VSKAALPPFTLTAAHAGMPRNRRCGFFGPDWAPFLLTSRVDVSSPVEPEDAAQ